MKEQNKLADTEQKKSKQVLRYYIEIPDNKNGKIAAELYTKNRLSDKELNLFVVEFAEENKICASYALANCKYKIENKTSKP